MKTKQFPLVSLSDKNPEVLASYVKCEQFGRVWFEGVYFVPGAEESKKLSPIGFGKTIYAVKKYLLSHYEIGF